MLEQDRTHFTDISLDTKRSIAQPKIEQLYGHCFGIDEFEEESYVPTGGDNVFNQETNLGVRGDFASFQGMFEEALAIASKCNLEKLGEWLQRQNIEISPKLFAALFAFTKVYESRFPDHPERSEARRALYAQSNDDMKLSDIFKANVAECAEIAAIAKYYLQRAGIDSQYISGDVLWTRDIEFSEQHSFIEITDGDKKYLYDPANPVSTTDGKCPSIYSTEADFAQEIRKNKKRFVTAKNLISKKEAFFGVNDASNVTEIDIV